MLRTILASALVAVATANPCDECNGAGAAICFQNTAPGACTGGNATTKGVITITSPYGACADAGPCAPCYPDSFCDGTSLPAKVYHDGTILEVGGSTANSITVPVPTDFPECPTVINKDNWLGGETYPDFFNTERSDDLLSITITRGDANEGWGMNLRFDCDPDIVSTEIVTDWTHQGNATVGWPYIPTNGENGCDGAQEGCGGYYCCGDAKCNGVRECSNGLASCACPMDGEPEPHPVVPVEGENGCSNPQKGCGGHYCCGDSRCNLGRTCGGLHHCACPMFGGDPTTTTTTPPPTLCNQVPASCLYDTPLNVSGTSDACAAVAAPYVITFPECLACDPPMISAATVCAACKQAGHDHFVSECPDEVAAYEIRTNPAANVYGKEDGIGGWGGECTCPDGQVYSVGDNSDSCGSIACTNGKVTKQCGEGVIPASRAGHSVVCSKTAKPVDAATLEKTALTAVVVAAKDRLAATGCGTEDEEVADAETCVALQKAVEQAEAALAAASEDSSAATATASLAVAAVAAAMLL